MVQPDAFLQDGEIQIQKRFTAEHCRDLSVRDAGSAAADWYFLLPVLWGNAERIPLLQQTHCIWVVQVWLCEAKL